MRSHFSSSRAQASTAAMWPVSLRMRPPQRYTVQLFRPDGSNPRCVKPIPANVTSGGVSTRVSHSCNASVRKPSPTDCNVMVPPLRSMPRCSIAVMSGKRRTAFPTSSRPTSTNRLILSLPNETFDPLAHCSRA